ncbi:hypothetical protein N7495_009601 [Penicillium taxi]|uniref:uncharacterized protein n=1 Tax=Penicillium taxi TaxID=168475 RepID=UPI0025452276|nr:uncharacterized protein N7495_009601 [Penicillium taxi]KAJ5885091.1 hypothetical protein N7495_009601 [Penicillium taxi]
MNDPGLDDAIADEANALDNSSGIKSKNIAGKDEDSEFEESLEGRWWLASTVYPLTAGTFGPMASAFNICCLSQTWRIKPDSKSGGINIPDPKWVIGFNAVSLAIALIANLALSLNMARRINFSIAQPIIIIGWYISSLILIGLLIALGVLMHRPENDGLIYSQAYFYGAFAAGIYFIISSLSVVTAYGAFKGHYSREYKLSNSQRTLMLQTIIFFIYLLGGSAVYGKVEGWRYLDAVFFADYTLLTIGIGNFAPTTHLGRGLLFPYAIGGIVILGLIISSIRTLMLERGRQKVADVLIARTHRLLVKRASSEHNHLRGLVPDLTHAEKEGNETSDHERQKREFITMRRIRQLANVQHKWLSLSISLVIWIVLWFMGAIVFWRSELHQSWTYFEALYFAYTTLLTIGYGDIYPQSNLGKSFFVFWSLLAIPSITILISNIGDTLIRFIREITIFIGEITILPSDEPYLDRIKDILHVHSANKWVSDEQSSQEDLFHDQIHNPKHPIPPLQHSQEAEECQKEEPAQASGDSAGARRHHYHYILFSEVRKLMDYAKSDHAREFSYHEWEYYLALISGKHKPSPFPEEISEEKELERRQSKSHEWSWIDKNNPLLGEKSEVDWLLCALTEALEKELRGASGGFLSDDGGFARRETI